jgi:environmental stress-induced protein Ves
MRTLRRFQADSFKGDWNTTGACTVPVTDFNLMTTGHTGGTLELVRLKDKEEYTVSFSGLHRFSGIYMLEGNISVVQKTKALVATKGDFISFTGDDAAHTSVQASEPCVFVLVKILFYI